MRSVHNVAKFVLPLIAAALIATPAAAQQAVPPKPYKPVAITLPAPLNDPAFTAFRGQVSDAAKKKDRAALARLVVAKGFFWDRETGDAADKKKTGPDNLAVALGLTKDGPGWDMLAGYTEDPTVSASLNHKGAMCAPADPGFNGKEMEDLAKATQTDPSEWGYTLSNGVEVRATPASSAPVVEKLGLQFVRVMPDASPAAAVGAMMRIVTPGGKFGYVPADSIAPLGNDQLCYVKDGGAWKIGGYIGGGDAD